jgi:hypothetical protein
MPSSRREKSKRKREKKRALKRKHEHLTEQLAEEAAKRKRTHREGWVVVVVLVMFVVLMVGGVIWWPTKATQGNRPGETGVPDGTYSLVYLYTEPAEGSTGAVTALDYNGAVIFVNEHDLAGEAAENTDAFFEGQRGEPVQIEVEDGYVTEWR